MIGFGAWPKGSITGAQYLFLVTSSFMAMGMYEFPADLAERAGRAGLFSLLISITLAFGGAVAFLALARRFPGWTAVDYIPKVLGRWPGKLLIAALVVIHLFVTTATLEAFTRQIRNVVLPQTPGGVVAALLLGTAAYLALLGLPALGSTCLVAFSLAWFVMILINLVALQRVQAIQLVPSLAPGWESVLRGVYKVFYPFVAFEILYLLPAFLANRRRLSLAYWGVGINSLTFVVLFLVPMGALGIDTLRILTRPPAFMMRIVRFPGFLVEHVGYVVVVSITVFNCLFTALQIWAVSLVVAGLFGLPRDRYRLFVLPVTAAIFLARLIYKDPHQLSIHFTGLLSPMGLVVGVLLPAVLYLVARLRGFKPPPGEQGGTESSPDTKHGGGP